MSDQLIIGLLDRLVGQPWVLVTVRPSSTSDELDLTCLAGGGISDTETVMQLLRKAVEAADRPEMIKETMYDD